MTTTIDFTTLRRACVVALQNSGQFGADWVRDAVGTVPREAFAPSRVWLSDKGQGQDGLYPLVDRDTDPAAWARAVYRHDQALITQVDDGVGAEAPASAKDRWLSSSLSSLRVVARQLSHLGLEPGHKVLHIGTGTGYDCALLAHRTEARRVTTLEIDPALAARARRNLSDAGLPDVRVIHGDGEHGWPPGAPYDRVLATASAMRVPWAWVRQTAPGGVILTPYRGLALPRLTVADDRGSATGPVVDAMSFMTLRGQRGTGRPDMRETIDATLPEAERRRTDTDLAPLDGELAAEFLFHVLVPDVAVAFGKSTWWFEAKDGASWAAWKQDGRGRQWGGRRLLDEAEAAVAAWSEAGRPALTDLGVTVTRAGDRIWAGTPEGPSWPVPGR
ncbi:methyltransferase domain-containing protein [Streptomyces sp. UNOC14_S4]|uniref:methyltransferase domain-containing protein n=1 Tax=Streptomyces sp. UNOC14_S4 TaxID=2872340 RepID=UPI001E4C7636|nr:methyltransferase domain-containing protein [Streptomyces sp. UNOC14_S4]MCC3767817.1 methyltransferase domain-containing protein [Streptomyces sp. UNOC14_S4]